MMHRGVKKAEGRVDEKWKEEGRWRRPQTLGNPKVTSLGAEGAQSTSLVGSL